MKTLYNTVQQCEGILDPDQNKVMDRMKVDVIRQCIQEYCTYSRARHRRGKCWPVTDPRLTITKIDKDEKGSIILGCDIYIITDKAKKLIKDVIGPKLIKK